MACRRFAGGWRHKKRVERASTQAPRWSFLRHRWNPRFLQPRLQRRCIRERADDGQQQIVDRRIAVAALGCNDHINAAGKIQPHFDVNKTLFLPFFFQREEKDLHRKDDCMKINWSLRFHNKVWLTTLLAVVCTFVFNLLDLFGIETTVAQEQVMQLGAALLSLLSTLGVVIDPTTPGVSDSQTVIERK